MKDLQSYLDNALKHVQLDAMIDAPIPEYYDIYEELRRLIVETRDHLDITQTQLAEKSGISLFDISSIESGNHHPSIATLKKIADAFGKRLVIDFTDREDLE